MEDDRSKLYAAIVDAYQQTQSVIKTMEVTGASKLMVQKVLLTEGMWESRRSREVKKLKDAGYTSKEIADQLHISVNGVQAYLPYSRSLYGSAKTGDSIRSRKKRENMKAAAKRQDPHFAKTEALQTSHMIGDELHLNSIPVFHREDNRNSKAEKKKNPSLFKLHLELVQDENGTPLRLSDEEIAQLKRFARMRTGISRDIIVPVDMTLHALHYAIQRLFGWGNSHLRQFSFLPKDFVSLTNGLTSLWEYYCGVYFRFPQEDDQEPFWDDDYEGQQSFKTWLKQKYKGPYNGYSASDTFHENQYQVRQLQDYLEKKLKDKNVLTLDELQSQLWLGGDFNCLLERLRLSELFVPAGVEIPEKKEWEVFMQDSLARARKNVNESDDQEINRYMYYIASMQKKERAERIVMYELERMRKTMEPELLPFVHEIIYQYDFGDGWCVKVSCEEGYYYNDSFDLAGNQFVLVKSNEADFLGDRDYYRSSDDLPVCEESNELMRHTEWKQMPVCVDADGMNLVDDVGGVYGYVDFIRTLHGDDKEAAKEMLEWAEGLGWSSRMYKPEKML